MVFEDCHWYIWNIASFLVTTNVLVVDPQYCLWHVALSPKNSFLVSLFFGHPQTTLASFGALVMEAMWLIKTKLVDRLNVP